MLIAGHGTTCREIVTLNEFDDLKVIFDTI